MKIIRWIKHRLKHKISHFSLSSLKETFKKHGVALVVIVVVWEIIEDVLFPLLFIWLGNNVNPWFITGAPISWLLCLHPIVVPVTWAAWMKFSNTKQEKVQ